MPVFDQLGDPVCPDCLCEHHEAAYADYKATTAGTAKAANTDLEPDATTLVTTQITITEHCCIIVNAAIMAPFIYPSTDFEIERPLGTLRTTQEDTLVTGNYVLMHYAAWETLPPGIYDYFLVNRSGGGRNINGAWLKAIASDCEG